MERIVPLLILLVIEVEVLIILCELTNAMK